MEFFSFVFCILFVPLILVLAYIGIKMRVTYLASPESFNPGEYRAIVLSIIACITAMLSIFRLWFPYTLWGNIVQLSLPIGLFLGLLLGIGWHLCIRKSIPKLFGKALTIVGILVLLMAVSTIANIKSALSLLSEQNKQMSSVRSLTRANILQADFVFDPGDKISLKDTDSIKAIKDFFADAKISKLKKISGARNVKIEIKTDEKSFIYEAYLLNNRQNDIGIKVSENEGTRFIHLPGLKRWLDENILNKKE